jgi:hypothetical protein
MYNILFENTNTFTLFVGHLLDRNRNLIYNRELLTGNTSHLNTIKITFARHSSRIVSHDIT